MNEAVGETIIDKISDGEAIGEVIVGMVHKFVEAVPQVVSDVQLVHLEKTIVAEEAIVAEPQVSVIEVFVPEFSIVVQSNLNETKVFVAESISQADQAVLFLEYASLLNSQALNMTLANLQIIPRIGPSSLDFDRTDENTLDRILTI